MSAILPSPFKFGLPILPVIERPDGLAKSFVRLGRCRPGFAEALDPPRASRRRCMSEAFALTIPVDQGIRNTSDIASKHLNTGLLL